MYNLLRYLLKKSRQKNQDGIFLKKLNQLLGFHPKKTILFQQVFTHSSEHKIDKDGRPFNFERLEFLGDAILGAHIANYLFEVYPNGNEGDLTKLRSKIVSRQNLNNLGKDLNLTSFLNPKFRHNNLGENINGNLLEALIGAIYLDQGFEKAQEFIQENIINQLQNIDTLENKIISYKSLFIEYCQKYKKTFEFITEQQESNEPNIHFGVKLLLDNKVIAKARDTSKKKAEEKAAKRAYFALTEIQKFHSK